MALSYLYVLYVYNKKTNIKKTMTKDQAKKANNNLESNKRWKLA